MTYEEAKRRRLRIETEHAIEAKTRGDTPRLRELNRDLCHAIFEEAHARRDTAGTRQG